MRHLDGVRIPTPYFDDKGNHCQRCGVRTVGLVDIYLRQPNNFGTRMVFNLPCGHGHFHPQLSPEECALGMLMLEAP